MSYRRVAAGGRRDVAEGPIVAAARQIGAEVWFLSGCGNPDLLLRFRGRLFAAEIKSRGGRETPNQGKFPVWRDVTDMLDALGVR